MLGLVTIREKGVYRKEFEALVGRMGGKKKPAVVAVGGKMMRLMYSVARSQRTLDCATGRVLHRSGNGEILSEFARRAFALSNRAVYAYDCS